jgi:hypothetical protein
MEHSQLRGLSSIRFNNNFVGSQGGDVYGGLPGILFLLVDVHLSQGRFCLAQMD